MTTIGWEKIFTQVWHNELSKRELEDIGIDITDRKWSRLFGKSANRANYFFCNRYKNRHAIVRFDDGKILALDESDYCEAKYQISEDDLQLFTFKKQTFIQDLRKYAFGSEFQSAGQFNGPTCWKLGNLVDRYKVFFIYDTDKSKLQQALFQIRKDHTDKYPVILVSISKRWIDTEIINIIDSFKWHIIFLEHRLLLDNSGFIRTDVPFQQLDELKDLISIVSDQGGSAATRQALRGFIDLDKKFLTKHPRAKPPYPIQVLHLRYGQNMSTEKIAKQLNCTPRKIQLILDWIPAHIKIAYQKNSIELKPRDPRSIKQENMSYRNR